MFGASAWAYQRDLIGPGPSRAGVVGIVAVSLLGAVVAGFLAQRHYFEGRYENLSPQLRIAEAVRWANDASDERIAISGVRGVFNQYTFAGPDLSNHVQWLGIEGEDKAFLRIPDCETWREEINAGGYTYVVTLYDPYNPSGLTDTKEALWTREDPGASEVLRDGPVSIFEIDSELDPGACGDLPDLSEAELTGESVNNEPIANQPPLGSGGTESKWTMLGNGRRGPPYRLRLGRHRPRAHAGCRLEAARVGRGRRRLRRARRDRAIRGAPARERPDRRDDPWASHDRLRSRYAPRNA